MKKERIDYLDMAKGIGIIMVVAGHSTFLQEDILTWISSFHMPLFFVLAGILLQIKGEENKKISVIIKSKLRSIMVPYVGFSLIYLLIDAAYLILKQDNITIVDLQRSGIEAITLYGMSVLWFLPALFFAETGFLLLRKKTNIKWTIFITVILAVITSFIVPLFKEYYPMFLSMPVLWVGYFLTSLLRGMVGMIFLSAGYFSTKFLNDKVAGTHIYIGRKSVNLKEIGLGVLFLLLSIASGMVNKRVDLHTLVINQAFLYYIAALSGAAWVILFCRNIPSLKMIRYFGKNSLIIMATHLDCQIMIAAIHFSYFVNQYITRAKQYVFYLTLAIAVLALEVITIYIINRFFPFLLGRKHTRSLYVKYRKKN